MNVADLNARQVNAARQTLIAAGVQAGAKLDQASTKLNLRGKALDKKDPTGQTAGAKAQADKQKSIAGYLAWNWNALHQAWLDELTQAERR